MQFPSDISTKEIECVELIRDGIHDYVSLVTLATVSREGDSRRALTWHSSVGGES